jgi:glycosyltransferase involved in cell wall biosynthesis
VLSVLHLCPVWFPVSPDSLGGIETFLPGLVRALSGLGCESTVLASGDSRVDTRLIPGVERNLFGEMAAGRAAEYLYYEQHALITAIRAAAGFDVIHSHVGPSAYLLSAVPGLGERILHTFHNDVTSDLEWFVREHPDLWYSTVSDYQAERLRRHGARHCRAIPNGLDVSAFPFCGSAGGALLFLGRMEHDKGPDIAVRVARRTGRPLVLAGPILDGDYFATQLAPMLGHGVHYAGVLDRDEKAGLLAEAGCLLMPSRCAEGFGMAAVEAMACGTPVVAAASGALPEVVEDGLTGFTAEQEDELPALVEKAVSLDRHRVRARTAERFSVEAVARGYVDLYQALRPAARRR